MSRQGDEFRGRISPGRAMLEHGIQNEQQLAHAGYESQLLRLTSRQQPLVEVPDDGVAAAAHQRSHVQGSANPGASAPDGPLDSQGAAVPVEGSHSHQGGDLPAVQCAQLRQVSQKSEGKPLSHAGDGPQKVVLLTPYGTLAESLPQVLVQVLQLLLQPAAVGLNAGTDSDVGGSPRRFFSETSMVST